MIARPEAENGDPGGKPEWHLLWYNAKGAKSEFPTYVPHPSEVTLPRRIKVALALLALLCACGGILGSVAFARSCDPPKPTKAELRRFLVEEMNVQFGD